MSSFPHEIDLFGIYLSPFVIVFSLAFLLASLSAAVLNKLKMARFFYYPHYVYLAFVVFYMVLIDRFFIKF